MNVMYLQFPSKLANPDSDEAEEDETSMNIETHCLQLPLENKSWEQVSHYFYVTQIQHFCKTYFWLDLFEENNIWGNNISNIYILISLEIKESSLQYHFLLEKNQYCPCNMLSEESEVIL